MQQLISQSSCKVLVENLILADNFWRRLIGLLPYSKLEPSAGMLLTNCSSVHTLFMRFTIDVVYLNEEMAVIALHPGVKPWKIVKINPNTRHILELPDGALARNQIGIGAKVAVKGHSVLPKHSLAPGPGKTARST